MMFGLVNNHKKTIFKEKPELGIEEKYARFGFFGQKMDDREFIAFYPALKYASQGGEIG